MAMSRTSAVFEDPSVLFSYNNSSTSLIGTHISINYSKEEPLKRALEKVHKYGGNIIQIFSDLRILNSSADDIKSLRSYMKDNGMRIYIHSSYTHNIASEWDNYSLIIKSIQSEIEIANLINASAIVIHFGKSKKLDISEAYNNMYTLLMHIHKLTKQYSNVRILLETPAGPSYVINLMILFISLIKLKRVIFLVIESEYAWIRVIYFH